MFMSPSAVAGRAARPQVLAAQHEVVGDDRAWTSSSTASKSRPAPAAPRLRPARRPAAPADCSAFCSAALRRFFGAAAALDRALGRDDVGQRLGRVRIVEELQDPVDLDARRLRAARRPRLFGRRSSPVIFSDASTPTSPSSLSMSSKLSESIVMLTAPTCLSCTASSPDDVSGSPCSSRIWNSEAAPCPACSSIRVFRPVYETPPSGTPNAPSLMSMKPSRCGSSPDPVTRTSACSVPVTLVTHVGEALDEPEVDRRGLDLQVDCFVRPSAATCARPCSRRNSDIGTCPSP